MQLSKQPNGGLRVGITGSMAVGKTTLCKNFDSWGRQHQLEVHYISYDQVRSDLLERCSSVRAAAVREGLIELFGEEVRNTFGFIDRRRLADIIYWDEQALLEHDVIVESVVLEMSEERMSELEGIVLFEWALMAERRQIEIVDFNIVLLDCSVEERLRRLQGQDLSQEHCERRISLQQTTEEKYEELLELVESNHGRLWLCRTDKDSMRVESLFEEIARLGRNNECIESCV